MLHDHLVEQHGVDPNTYTNPLVSKDLEKAFNRKKVKRTRAPEPHQLQTKLMGIPFPINPYIGEDLCLPLPEHYTLPSSGPAQEAFRRAVISINRGHPTYIWGPPGTGKDALPHAISNLTRSPAAVFTFTAGTDIKRWFYSREIQPEGTSWSYGTLWKMLTQGVLGEDGQYHPAIIVFSDVDRGTPDQLEEFRLLLDTTSKRLVGPTGEVAHVIPGTRFVFTANSPGSGDPSGRMSSRIMDSSLLDRMGRFIEFTHMEWRDECAIYQAKFPTLTSKVSTEFWASLGKCVAALRKALSGKDSGVMLDGDLTMRGIFAILAECEDEIHFNTSTNLPPKLLARGFKAWLDRLDEDNKIVASRIIDPYTGAI